MTTNFELSIEELQTAVESLHDCTGTYSRVERIHETFKGQTVWEGDVYVFALTGHPTASICYAWSSPVEGSDLRKVFAVLQVPPVASATDAVRASIVQGYRKSD
jgi:hypothetical protein